MKPFEICEDVYQIGGPYLSDPDDCSVYLVRSEPQLVLIDCGAGRSFEKLMENIRALGFQPEQLKTIIATHAHIDHIGALAEFKKEFGCQVVAHYRDAERIESGEGTGAEWYGLPYTPCQVDIKLTQGEESLNLGKHIFKLLHVPGHTPGSLVCYLDIGGQRVLFGQDIHGPYNLPGSDPELARKSLQKLIELEADILCEGHFGIFQPKQEVRRYIERYLRGL